MKGLAYKEWVQNRWYILSMILLGLMPVLMMFLLRDVMSAEEIADDTTGFFKLRTIGVVIAFLASGLLESMVIIRSDDRKLWGYFISSTEEGYRGFIRVKYEMVYIMIVMASMSLMIADQITVLFLSDTRHIAADSTQNIIVVLTVLQLLMRAVDFPFIIRFGEKRGNIIKLIMLLSLFIIVIILLMTDAGGINVKLYDAVSSLITEKNALLAVSSAGLAVLAVYYLSYRISCRLYLKGVEEYVK